MGTGWWREMRTEKWLATAQVISSLVMLLLCPESETDRTRSLRLCFAFASAVPPEVMSPRARQGDMRC